MRNFHMYYKNVVHSKNENIEKIEINPHWLYYFSFLPFKLNTDGIQHILVETQKPWTPS